MTMNNKKTLSENTGVIQLVKPQTDFGSSNGSNLSELSRINGKRHKKSETTFASRRIIINPYLQEWERARLVGWPYFSP